MEFFYFYFCLQKFSAYKFCWVIFFALFSTDPNAASNFAFYYTHVKCFAYIRTFANCKAKIKTKGLKKMKNVFYECVLESHFTSISGLVGSIVSEIFKIGLPFCSRFHRS
jgi:hypothetical protein